MLELGKVIRNLISAAAFARAPRDPVVGCPLAGTHNLGVLGVTEQGFHVSREAADGVGGEARGDDAARGSWSFHDELVQVFSAGGRRPGGPGTRGSAPV